MSCSWDGSPRRMPAPPALTWREAYKWLRSTRRNSPADVEWYGQMRFPRFVQHVAAALGWPVAVGAAALGVLGSLPAVALGVGSVLVTISLGDHQKPGVVIGASFLAFLLSLFTSHVLLTWKPWRRSLELASVKGTHRRPGTLGLMFGVLPKDTFRVKHALLGAGFPYVKVSYSAGDPPEISGKVDATILLDSTSGLDEVEARRRAESAIKRVEVGWRDLGLWRA